MLRILVWFSVKLSLIDSKSIIGTSTLHVIPNLKPTCFRPEIIWRYSTKHAKLWLRGLGCTLKYTLTAEWNSYDYSKIRCWIAWSWFVTILKNKIHWVYSNKPQTFVRLFVCLFACLFVCVCLSFACLWACRFKWWFFCLFVCFCFFVFLGFFLMIFFYCIFHWLVWFAWCLIFLFFV